MKVVHLVAGELSGGLSVPFWEYKTEFHLWAPELFYGVVRNLKND